MVQNLTGILKLLPPHCFALLNNKGGEPRNTTDTFGKYRYIIITIILKRNLHGFFENAVELYHTWQAIIYPV